MGGADDRAENARLPVAARWLNALLSESSRARARADLGHHETVSLAEGIARTIAWQRQYYGV